LGYLADRYRAKAVADNAKADNWVFVRTDGSGLPLWDSGVRQALKRAAVAEGCDFPGLGPHSLRRAYITWVQEAGGSSIEASKMAGHSTVRMTEGYTKIQLNRQADLTRRIQERLASAGEKLSGEHGTDSEIPAPPSAKFAVLDGTRRRTPDHPLNARPVRTRGSAAKTKAASRSEHFRAGIQLSRNT